MTVECSKCHKKLEDGVDGRYNSPGGVFCIKCGENKPWQRKEIASPEKRRRPDRLVFRGDVRGHSVPDKVTLGRYEIDGKLLAEYIDCVDFIRRATKLGPAMDDPLLVQKALAKREEIHRNIFKSLGVKYLEDGQPIHGESILLNELLDAYMQGRGI